MSDEKAPQGTHALAPLQLRRPLTTPSTESQPPLPPLSKPPLPPPNPPKAPATPEDASPEPLSELPSSISDKSPPPPPQSLAPPRPVTLPARSSDTRERASITAMAQPSTDLSKPAEASPPTDPPGPSPLTAPVPALNTAPAPSPSPSPPPPPPLLRDSPSKLLAPTRAHSKTGVLDEPSDPLPPQGGPPPLPGAIPGTPTRKADTSSAPAPDAGEGTVVAGDRGGPPGASRASKREPPKAPPPPGAVDHPSVTTDGKMVEQYIPFGFVELRGKLLADFPEVFSDTQVAAKFVELCKWISLRNTLRLSLDYGDADEKYAPLDPDKDTLAFRAAAAAEDLGGTKTTASPPPTSKNVVHKSNIKELVEDLYSELDRILDIAEFTELPPDHLENAKLHKSLMGLDVTSSAEEFLEYRVHYRGTRMKKIQFLRWGLFKRQIEMHVYERLAICFRLKKPVRSDDDPVEPPDSLSAGIDTRPWYRRMLCGCGTSAPTALMELQDDFVYMKLFKDVLQSDVDMLLPGAVIRFTWWDHLMVWVPILVGCGMAIWKAASGTIKFDNIFDAALSVALIVMPITWGARAYMAVREKQRVHEAHLNALFLLHNLNNNAGVISQLIGEAQEQEDNEAMLAYFFLWQGHASPSPLPKLDLDRTVEAYLQKKLDDLGVAVRMDYEVLDSITKLERMGLLTSIKGEDGVRKLQVLPLDQTLEKAHVRHFDENREAGQPRVPPSEAKRQGCLQLAWHECVDIFRPTGQKFRYFWNAQTGESQYHEPDEPYIKLGAAAALDLEDAHGLNMADPKNYDKPLHHVKTA